MADLDGGWPVVAGAGGLAGFLDAVVVVAGSPDGARAGPVPPRRVDLRGELGQDTGQDLSPALREVRRPGGGAADDAQDAGVADPVRVQVGGPGRPGDQDADRLVHGLVCSDLLIHQVRQP